MAKEEKFDLLVRVRDEASAALTGITGNVLKMVAGFAAIRTVTGFLKDSVAAAIEAEGVWNDLSASVDRHGGSWDRAGDAMRKNITAMQRNLGLGDEAIARSTQMFVDYGASTSQAFKLVEAAANLAAGKHIALETATDMLAKATAGNTILFSRYGFELDKTAGSATALNQVLGWINEKWGDAATAKLKANTGQLALLNEQYGDLKENIGGLVSGPMLPLLKTMNDLLFVFNNTKRSSDDLVEVLKFLGANAILPVIGPAILLGTKLDDLGAKADELAKSMEEDWDAAMLLLGIGESGATSPLRQEVQATVEALRQAKTEFQALDELGGYQTRRAEGGTPSKYTSERDFQKPTEEELRFQAESLKRWEEYRDMFVGITTSAVDDLVSQFEEGRVRLDEIFKGIASDFLRAMVSMGIARLAAAAFGAIFSGPAGAAVAASGGSDSAYGRIPNPKVSPSAMVVNFNGPVVADRDYIRTVIVPELNRLSRYNAGVR